MALTAKVLNSDAALNSHQVVGNIKFFAGEQLTLNFKLHDPEQDLRYIPPATTVMTVTFNKTSGTLAKTATLNADDRSMASVALTVTETADLIGGNLSFKLDELNNGVQIKYGTIANALSLVRTDA